MRRLPGHSCTKVIGQLPNGLSNACDHFDSLVKKIDPNHSFCEEYDDNSPIN